MKSKSATVSRINRIRDALDVQLRNSELRKGTISDMDLASEAARKYISDGDVRMTKVKLGSPWYSHRQRKALAAWLSGQVDAGVQDMVAAVWTAYLDSLYCWNGFRAGAVHQRFEQLGIGRLLAAYVLGQQPVLGGVARMYLACEDSDDLDFFLSENIHNIDDIAGSKWDLLYLLKSLGYDIGHLIHDEAYLAEGLGDYAEFIRPDKGRISEVLYQLCDAHVYACSTKNKEDTLWGLFPVRILAHMKLAGLVVADYADVHPLLALPTCQVDFNRKYELTDPLIVDYRDLVVKFFPGGLVPETG